MSQVDGMRLIARWCPRCKVQSDTRWHLCKPAAPLFPQTAQETQCEEIDCIPLADARGAVSENGKLRQALLHCSGYFRWGQDAWIHKDDEGTVLSEDDAVAAVVGGQ